ncbi:MAG: peptidoglycan-associated lipoprotein Pal [Azospirillaceae bacterium]
MRFKILTVIAAVLIVAGCSTPEDDMATDAASSGSTSAQSNVPPGTEQGLVQVGDRVFFQFDRYDLTSEAQSTLQAQAAWLNAYPSIGLLIEGHADERGTREYNLALGERRANSVRNYLIALGIEPGRLQTISYGKERPAVVGSNEQAWAQNRRGVSVIR